MSISPDDMHDDSCSRSFDSKSSVKLPALSAIDRELERWEWRKWLAQRPEMDLGVAAVELLDEERALRDMELGKRVYFLDC